MISKGKNTKFGIRRYHAEDIPLVYKAVRESITELLPFLPWCHPDYSIDDCSSWILSRDETWRNETEYSFAIYDLQTGAFVGGIGLSQINRTHQMANLGYWVRSISAGQGAATTATRLAAQFGFGELGLNRIEIVAVVENTASQRVAEKAGAKREGILRKRLMIHGKLYDAVLYSLVIEDMNT